jgi:hypothetical protein
MEIKKSDWLLALAVAETYDARLTMIAPANMSPTFRYGEWIGAVEHTRKFQSVVVRHTSPAQISIQQNWVPCPDSDVRKGWAFRVKNCAPSQVKELLDQLVAAEAEGP